MRATTWLTSAAARLARQRRDPGSRERRLARATPIIQRRLARYGGARSPAREETNLGQKQSEFELSC